MALRERQRIARQRARRVGRVWHEDLASSRDSVVRRATLPEGLDGLEDTPDPARLAQAALGSTVSCALLVYGGRPCWAQL